MLSETHEVKMGAGVWAGLANGPGGVAHPLRLTAAASGPAPGQKPKGGPGVGFEPPPHHPPSPLNPSTPCLQARARDGRAGGGGSALEPRGWATGEGASQFQPRAVHASDAYRCRCPII